MFLNKNECTVQNLPSYNANTYFYEHRYFQFSVRVNQNSENQQNSFPTSYGEREWDRGSGGGQFYESSILTGFLESSTELSKETYFRSFYECLIPHYSTLVRRFFIASKMLNSEAHSYLYLSKRIFRLRQFLLNNMNKKIN